MGTKTYTAVCILMCAACATHAFEKLGLKWELGESPTESAAPKTFIPAEVPGAVQLDFAKALKYPDYRFADNVKKLDWLEDRFFTYKTSFKKPALKSNERLLFYSESIDYRYKIRVNKTEVFAGEGMFTPVKIDITDNLKDADNLLEVVVYPIPKAYPDKNFGPLGYRTQADHSFKPPVSYGWDWHPRLVQLGICGETYLIVSDKSRLDDVYVNYELSDDFSRADICIEVEGKNLEGTKYEWILSDQNGGVVAKSEGKLDGDIQKIGGIVLKNPELWWPHDHGAQTLYKSEFRLLSQNGRLLQTDTNEVGFRRIRLVQNEGVSALPTLSRMLPPMQIMVNGKKIFAKGSNWVSPEIFHARVSDARYDALTTIAVEMNFNIFRMWGGSPVAKEAFFKLCDKKGIMVWQDFILSCNNYPDEKHYLDVLSREATSIAKRLRKHPSLACWCGGNELFKEWSGMDDQSLALRRLNAITLELTPLIPFQMASPLMGVAHGPYRFKIFPEIAGKDGVNVIEFWPKQKFTAYTEFGFSSMSPIETIRKIIPPEEIKFPIEQTDSWILHHAFKNKSRWAGIDAIHSKQYITTKIFGSTKTLEEHIEKTQFLQAQILRFMFEECRRQKPFCSMALNWCYNDVWECAGNLSIIAYPAIKKQAFHSVKAACRPVLASARFNKLVLRPSEKLEAELFVLNDTHKGIGPLDIVAKIEIDGKTHILGEFKSQRTAPNRNTEVGKCNFEIPDLGKDVRRFKMTLEVRGHPEYSSEYEFVYNPNFHMKRI